MLDREEYVEQAYFFRTLVERIRQSLGTQDVLSSIREEILATTKLPLAIDFMSSELRLQGVMATAMAKLPHYFTEFQTFVVAEAENERGKFDLRTALEILAREAEYRVAGAAPPGVFLYEFESICRNRLGYDKGLKAIAADPVFDEAWRNWILMLRRQVGLIDIAELIYLSSRHFARRQAAADGDEEKPALFGEGEGRIAMANRGRDPLLLFAALHRHLGYPEVPRPTPVDETPQLLPMLLRRVERMEARLKLVEEEQRGGIDLSRFMGPPPSGPSREIDEP